MAELKKIRFLIFVLLMIFPANALDVILSNARGDNKQQSKIQTNIINEEKIYDGTVNELTYQAQPNVAKAIVYISSKSRFVEIMRHAVREIRLQIDQELRAKRCELVFLGIDNFDNDEYHLIADFMLNKIQPHRTQKKYFIIETIGENRFDYLYQSSKFDYVLNFSKYQENAHICGGTLEASLRSIPHGTVTRVQSNGKEIKLYEHETEYRHAKEATWPIHVEDNKYVIKYSVTNSNHNFKMNHPNKMIHLVILSGKEYSRATNIGGRSSEMTQIRDFQREMETNNEVLIILGAFNFDWTEIYIVTQFILKQSEGGPTSDYNVFTCGFGIFNTIYLHFDEDDERYLLQRPNSNVAEIMKVLIGAEVQQRSIEMCYHWDNEWKFLEFPVNLVNGRYFSEESLNYFHFPWLNEEIAFIVYESADLNNAIDQSMMFQTVEDLEPSRIHVVMIQAINFGSDDMHIIAEWIDYHRGNISSEQIAVSGGGIFDTTFQSEITTYDTFAEKKNELKSIRNAFLKSVALKCVFAVEINYANLEFVSYPVNTINGFYEPDLISDRNMFDTRNGRNLFFIITSAKFFHKMFKREDVRKFVSLLRGKLMKEDPVLEWGIFLVGLDNFGKRDSHLFAELVKTHTNDERSLGEFVRVFHYGISEAIYQYKDTAPLINEDRKRIRAFIITFFEWTRKLLQSSS